jgi:hypothetical protein
VKAGVNNLSIAIPKKGTNTDSVALFTTNLTLTAGKNYTVHVSDTSAKTSALLVEDNMDIIEVGKARYKFVNMMPNVPLADLYFGSTLVAPGVGYLGQSNYFTLPFSTTATAWNVRETGTGPTGLILATYSSINTTLNQRGYTVFALGYKGATGARLPFVSFLLNK